MKRKISLDQTYLICTTLFSVVLVLTNIIGVKLFQGPFNPSSHALTTGIITYPLTFLITDVVSEIWGLKKANAMVLIGFFMSFVMWMTGLPCSGKTTIAKKLPEHIPNLAILDGDEMRELLSPNEDFSRSGIINHNKKVANIAKLLLEHDVSVCVSKISPFIEKNQ